MLLGLGIFSVAAGCLHPGATTLPLLRLAAP
jgi:hypothetical protein